MLRPTVTFHQKLVCSAVYLWVLFSWIEFISNSLHFFYIYILVYVAIWLSITSACGLFLMIKTQFFESWRQGYHSINTNQNRLISTIYIRFIRIWKNISSHIIIYRSLNWKLPYIGIVIARKRIFVILFDVITSVWLLLASSTVKENNFYFEVLRE